MISLVLVNRGKQPIAANHPVNLALSGHSLSVEISDSSSKTFHILTSAASVSPSLLFTQLETVLAALQRPRSYNCRLRRCTSCCCCCCNNTSWRDQEEKQYLQKLLSVTLAGLSLPGSCACRSPTDNCNWRDPLPGIPLLLRQGGTSRT